LEYEEIKDLRLPDVLINTLTRKIQEHQSFR